MLAIALYDCDTDTNPKLLIEVILEASKAPDKNGMDRAPSEFHLRRRRFQRPRRIRSECAMD